MTGDERLIPLGPLDAEPPPADTYPTVAGRAAGIRRGLRGVELGAHDERIVAWLARWDDGTVRTFLSWLERVRAAERAAAAVEVRAELDVMRREWLAMPAAERGPRAEEDAYCDGVLRAVAVLTGRRGGALDDGWEVAP